MRKVIKQQLAGVLLIPGLLGAVGYTVVKAASEDEVGTKTTQKTLQPVVVPIGGFPTFEAKSSDAIATSEVSSLSSSETSTSQNDFSGISPAIAVSTFKDSYSELEADSDVLHIHTKAHGNGTGVLQAYRQEITIDPEIAKEFFSTDNYKQYIHGTAYRTKDAVWPFDGTKEYDIATELWGKGSWIYTGDTMNYDSKAGCIYFKTSQYTVQLASGVDMEVDMYIDLGQWSKDTGKLIERKDNYSIQTKTDANSAALGFTSKVVGSVASDGIEDSWIENPVEPTTLYYLTEKNSYFYGNGLQDESNEHPTDYDIELSVNGIPYKYVQMATADGGTNARGETIKKGDWDFDFGNYLNEGDVVTARVRGRESEENSSGVKPTKYSTIAYPTDATNIISWKDWKVEEPTMPILYEDDLIIALHTPVQNQQLGRTYKLIVTVNDEEVYNKPVKDDMDVNVPYLSGLVKGDVVKAKIVGSQDGEEDKESSSISTTVITQADETYDNWQVQDAVINGPLYEGGTAISVYVPIQNRAVGRNYDLEVYLGDELIIDQKNIDVALKTYYFSYALSELDTDQERALAYGDKIKAVVIGHQPDDTDEKGNVTATYPDKQAASTLTVAETTGYEDWSVARPTLDPMKDTDTVITGNIGKQNTDAGRTYEVALSVDDEDPIYVTPAEDGTFKLDDVHLQDGQVITAKVIGHQDKREDKVSEETQATVGDATNYKGWKVEKPIVDDLDTTDTVITGNIGNQNKDYDRNYTVEVFVNGSSKGQAKVEDDGTFTSDKLTLSEGDKVTAKVTGHQTGKEDKSETSDEVVVVHKVAYEDWKVEQATIHELTAGKVTISGNIGNQNKDFDRNYEVEIFVNGNSKGQATLLENGTFTTKALQLAKGDEVQAKVIGHQEGKEDKTSLSEIVTVSGTEGGNRVDSTGMITFIPGDETTNPGVVDPENPGGGVEPEIPGVAGSIALDYASDLDFGSHKISTTDSTYYASTDKTTGGADFVAMHDLRGAGEWSITVTQNNQFTNQRAVELSGAQISFEKAIAVNTGIETGVGADMPSAVNITNLMIGAPSLVMSSNEAGSYGTYATKYGTKSDYLGNEEGGPISLSVPAGAAQVGDYQSTLEYSLNVVPN